MIGFLRGKVVNVRDGIVTMEVDGVGIGYEIIAPLTVADEGRNMRIWTRMVQREEATTLYGFNDPANRETFDHLCAISGVGPKAAFSVVNAFTLAEFHNRVIGQTDVKALMAIDGIGRKTASAIILALKKKTA